jgi:hypothetical protein
MGQKYDLGKSGYEDPWKIDDKPVQRSEPPLPLNTCPLATKNLYDPPYPVQKDIYEPPPELALLRAALTLIHLS